VGDEENAAGGLRVGVCYFPRCGNSHAPLSVGPDLGDDVARL
jgi:hypothetical protein